MSEDKLFLGVHLSTAKGITGLFEEANRLRINVFQFFLGSPRVWKGKLLLKEEIDIFLKEMEKYHFIGVHAPYLLNFASFDSDLYKRSINRAVQDINEMNKIGVKYYIFHPGTNQDLYKGIDRIRKAMEEILNKTKNVFLIVENTSGEKNDIGKNVAEIKEIISGYEDKVGVCLDTCHLFASGIDLRCYVKVEDFYNNLKKLGLDKLLKLIHTNDSKFSLGEKRDRHTHIGKGYVGEKGFQNLFKHHFFRKIPYVLETPKDNDMDLVNLAKLRSIWDGVCNK